MRLSLTSSHPRTMSLLGVPEFPAFPPVLSSPKTLPTGIRLTPVRDSALGWTVWPSGRPDSKYKSWSYLRVASNGVERWGQVAQNESEEEERGVWRALGTLLFDSNQERFWFDVLMVQCWIWLVGAVRHREWMLAWQLGKSSERRMVLSDVQYGVLESRLDFLNLESGELGT